MTCSEAFTEWSHRRYWPLAKHYQSIPHDIAVSGDPNVPAKSLCSNWRMKWAWALVSVHLHNLNEPLVYHPGYSLDGGQTFRRTIKAVKTRFYAFQIGPDPVIFSTFGRWGELVFTNCALHGTRLSWSQLHGCLHGPSEITCV